MCYIGSILTLIFAFDWHWLFYGWLMHWTLGAVGVSVAMHRCFSHRSWTPRNKVILLVMHFLAAITAMGSTITWAGTHRLHHKTADTNKDPHSPIGKSLWVKIKYWFNYWPSHAVSPMSVKDLLSDPYHKFFHKYYFHINIAWIALLLAIDYRLFLYCYLLANALTLQVTSWITVGAHLFGHQDIDCGDESKNTFIMGAYMWGEGWHNNHHAKPSVYEFGRHWWQLDIGAYLIKLLADPEKSRTYK